MHAGSASHGKGLFGAEAVFAMMMVLDDPRR